MALVLAACAVAPRQPLDLGRTLAARQQRSLGDLRPTAVDDGAGQDTWTTDDLVAAAWTLRPEIAAADAEVRAAEADGALAQRRAAPTIGLTPEFATNAAGSSPWVIAAAFAQALEPASRRQPRIDQADARTRAARWRAAALRWQVAAEVREAQRRVAWATQRRQSIDDERQLRRKVVELVRRRVDAGVAGQAELASANLQSALADAQATTAQQAHELALGALATAVGVAVADLDRHPPAAPELDHIPAADALLSPVGLDRAPLDRLDVAEALAAYDEAEAAEREQYASKNPITTIAPGYTFDQGTRKLVFGVSAELPTSGRHDDAARAARARREAARHRVEAALDRAQAEIDQASGALSASERALEAAAAVVNAQGELAQRVINRWHAGNADHVQAVQAEIDLLLAHRTLEDAAATRLDAIHAVELALQKPLWPVSALTSTPPAEHGEAKPP